MEREGNIYRERMEREKDTMMQQNASNVKSRLFRCMIYKH